MKRYSLSAVIIVTLVSENYDEIIKFSVLKSVLIYKKQILFGGKIQDIKGGKLVKIQRQFPIYLSILGPV